MDRYDLINKMVTEKSDYNPKEIDLDAYRNGLNDMYGELESKLNNNEVLDPFSRSFNEGATVEITGWVNGHEFELREKVTLIKKDDDLWLSRNKDNVEWWINEDEANVC